METSHIRWRRIDVPGTEDARFEQTSTGWHINGELDVQETDASAALRYQIDCDAHWRTLSALIDGNCSGRKIRFAIQADAAGNWKIDSIERADLNGALDIDLGFTPVTNTLPIKRLQLAIGQTANVSTAWLRFPELRFERLEQSYSRQSDYVYRFDTMIDNEPFSAQLDIDQYGIVTQYEGLWERAE